MDYDVEVKIYEAEVKRRAAKYLKEGTCSPWDALAKASAFVMKERRLKARLDMSLSNLIREAF